MPRAVLANPVGGVTATCWLATWLVTERAGVAATEAVVVAVAVGAAALDELDEKLGNDSAEEATELDTVAELDCAPMRGASQALSAAAAITKRAALEVVSRFIEISLVSCECLALQGSHRAIEITLPRCAAPIPMKANAPRACDQITPS